MPAPVNVEFPDIPTRRTMLHTGRRWRTKLVPYLFIGPATLMIDLSPSHFQGHCRFRFGCAAGQDEVGVGG